MLFNTFYNLLKTERSNNNGNKEFFDTVQAKLEKVLKSTATDQILNVVQKGGEYTYFTEFLGNYNNVTRNEDRDFASGLALNSLINIWTDLNSDGQLEYCADAPKAVIDLIDGLVYFLVDNINSYWTSLEGAFFSVSVKSVYTIPYYYPANMYEYLNGTKLPQFHNDSSIINDEYTGGARGYIQKEDYDKMINEIYYK